MEVKTLEVKSYVAEDGMVFDNEKDCLSYEKQPKQYFKVICHPDLTEGRGWTGCYAVRVFGQYEDVALCMVQDWCFKNLGKATAFVQGVSPMFNWKIIPCDKAAFEKGFQVSCGDYGYESKQLFLPEN